MGSSGRRFIADTAAWYGGDMAVIVLGAGVAIPLGHMVFVQGVYVCEPADIFKEGV